MTNEGTRAFFAIQPDDLGLNFLEDRMRLFATMGWERRGRFMSMEDLHVTLRFLGEINDETLNQAIAHGERLAAQTPAFTWRIARCTLFPRQSRARIIAATVEAPESMKQLARELEEAAVEMGLEPDERIFKPHITVARLKQENRRPNLPSRSGSIAQKAEKLILFGSEPSGDGPRFLVLAEWDLGTSASEVDAES